MRKRKRHFHDEQLSSVAKVLLEQMGIKRPMHYQEVAELLLKESKLFGPRANTPEQSVNAYLSELVHFTPFYERVGRGVYQIKLEFTRYKILRALQASSY